MIAARIPLDHSLAPGAPRPALLLSEREQTIRRLVDADRARVLRSPLLGAPRARRRPAGAHVLAPARPPAAGLRAQEPMARPPRTVHPPRRAELARLCPEDDVRLPREVLAPGPERYPSVAAPWREERLVGRCGLEEGRHAAGVVVVPARSADVVRRDGLGACDALVRRPVETHSGESVKGLRDRQGRTESTIEPWSGPRCGRPSTLTDSRYLGSLCSDEVLLRGRWTTVLAVSSHQYRGGDLDVRGIDVLRLVFARLGLCWWLQCINHCRLLVAVDQSCGRGQGWAGIGLSDPLASATLGAMLDT